MCYSIPAALLRARASPCGRIWRLLASWT
jgi:hypothetical protein